MTSHAASRQRHVAIIYSPRQGEVRVSHLAGDYNFRDEPWDHGYEWSDTPELDDIDRPAVIARLLDLKESQPNIPFGFRTGESRLEYLEGRLCFVASDGSEGLTCATFADLVFRSMGFPVVNLETWPNRPEDEQWRQRMLQHLRQQSLNRERVEKIAAAQREARVRPEELVSAFVQAGWPVSFERATSLVEQVIQDLDEAINDPPIVPYVSR